MCLSVSRLFWVSSLAYPNLLGTKGYVVVVATACLTLITKQKIPGEIRVTKNFPLFFMAKLVGI
jgi:hypothetical protein